MGYADVKNSVFLVIRGKEFGTGFLVHKDSQYTYVITCAHVVSREEGQISVNGRDASPFKSAAGFGNGKAGLDYLDLVVLRVEGSIGGVPLRLSETAQEGEAISIVGYYQPSSSVSPLQKEVSGHLGGSFQFSISKGLEHVDAWDLNIDENRQLQQGYSGSPVFNEQNLVIGFTVFGTHSGSRGMCIDAAAIRGIWRDAPLELYNGGTLREVTNGSTNSPVEVFVCYSSKDKKLVDEMEGSCLSRLESQGKIRVHHRDRIRAGLNVKEYIRSYISRANIIVLVVTSQFATDFFQKNEDEDLDAQISLFKKRKESGQARVIPILFETVAFWQDILDEDIKALPKSLCPVDDSRSWGNRKKAIAVVAKELSDEINLAR